jgi:RNA polymerase primary sigma factor
MDDSLRAQIEVALSSLEGREAEIIRLYYGIGREESLTLDEIGECYGLTRERIRQIKEKALRRLRHISRSRRLRPYLE